MTDDPKYAAAVDTFLTEPEALTQDQIDTLTQVDDRLGARAIAQRTAALRKSAEARHRAAMGTPPLATKGFDVEDAVDATIDSITLALVQPRRRIKALEDTLEQWQQKYRDLEQRLLELEAARAETR